MVSGTRANPPPELPLFLYKIQLTVYMRLRTRLGKARQLEGKGEGGGGGNACARWGEDVHSYSFSVVSHFVVEYVTWPNEG